MLSHVSEMSAVVRQLFATCSSGHKVTIYRTTCDTICTVAKRHTGLAHLTGSSTPHSHIEKYTGRPVALRASRIRGYRICGCVWLSLQLSYLHTSRSSAHAQYAV
jgi:hypothetical protein